MSRDEWEEMKLMVEEEQALAAAPKELSPGCKIALRLWTLGKSWKEIEEETGLTPAYVCTVKGSKKGQEYLASIEKELDLEFKRLYQKTINVLDKGLESADMGIALASANLALKVAGKFVQKVENRDLTAEDIIQKILSGELAAGERKPIDITGVVVSDSLDDVERERKGLPS